MAQVAQNHVRISIHAPRKGSDDIADMTSLRPKAFQSTLPAKGATHNKD